jgi:hypothetical protein
MLRSRLDKYAMRLTHDGFAKSHNFPEAARAREDSRMSRNPNDPAQDLRRNAVARIAINNSVQPISTKMVIAGVRSEGMNENVDVRQDHRSCIRSSRSLDRLRSTPGNVPPADFETGNRTRVRRRVRDSARMVLKPSSTSEVSVRPCSAAFFLALRNKSSESRIVVLICQSISSEASICQPLPFPVRVPPF